MKAARYLLTVAWLALAGHAMADNLTIANFSINPGEIKTISVELNNTENSYIAFEFYMTLPEGVFISEDEDGYLMADLNSARINRHVLEASLMSDGSYHFLCYSNNNNTFKGTGGEILSITLTADDSLEGGQELQGLVFNQKLSDNATNKVTFPDFRFNISVKGEQDDTPVTITIPMAGVAIYGSTQGLDFSMSTDFKAYIIAGYDRDEKTVFAMPVTHVPAGTGLYLVGKAGTYTVPTITNHTSYTNMLVGTKKAVTISATDGSYTNLTLSTDGAIPQFTAVGNNTSVEANKAYLQLPTALYDGSPVSIKYDEGKDGDLNKDGKVNVADVMILVKMAINQ